MFAKKMKNEKGFTLIEMLLAMTLGIVVMGVAIFTYNKQSTVLRIGNQETQTRGMARLAMDAMVSNIQTAGYGMPPGDSKINNGANPPVYSPRNAQGVSQASSTAITIMTNRSDISTYIARDPSVSPANAFLVPLNSAVTGVPATTFAVGDQIVFFDVSDPSITFRGDISSLTSPQSAGGVNYDLITLGSSIVTTAVKPIRDSVPFMVNQYHTITYTFNAIAETITLNDDQGTANNGDDITRVVANNVTNLTLTYFDTFGNTVDVSTPLDWANGTADQDELGSIRGIAIDLTVRDQNETAVTTTLTSAATLRNMGI
jgi:type II secretory pathway pseudopilin PulG